MAVCRGPFVTAFKVEKQHRVPLNFASVCCCVWLLFGVVVPSVCCFVFSTVCCYFCLLVAMCRYFSFCIFQI